MSAISLSNVSKAFGETRALRGADLRADFGEIHAIVGENGSGKSTLAKIISGVVLPDYGEIDVLGQTPKSPAQAISAGIATIYQEIFLAEDLTVWENVFAGSDGLWHRRIKTSEKRRQAEGILTRLAAADIDPDAIVSTLPLNIKQWIVISRALQQKPKLLIFDESSAALDLDSTNRLHQEMLELKEGGSCILLVTHRIAELVKIADSATVLRDGETVGRLEKADVTEDNLIRMMSAYGDRATRAERVKRVVSTEQKPALEARRVRLKPEAKLFDFKVHPGEIVGIAGLDGAGQAKFVRMLVGIEQPSEGEIRVWDASTENHQIVGLTSAEEAGIAYVSGDRKREGIFPNLSILENFGMALYDRLSGRNGLIDEAALKKSFEAERQRLGIKFGDASDKITTLSGGNQQKVLIARVLALDPRVIILNDPARGVDIGTKQDLYEHLRAFASNGGAVVYLSSEIEEFFHFADRADVFFYDSIFASFEGADIDEEHMLAAMFGRTGHVEFDEELSREGAA